jgi:hypothetical protein
MSYAVEEDTIIKAKDCEILTFIFDKCLIKREMYCEGTCGNLMKLEKAASYVDKFAFRCYTTGCSF